MRTRKGWNGLSFCVSNFIHCDFLKLIFSSCGLTNSQALFVGLIDSDKV